MRMYADIDMPPEYPRRVVQGAVRLLGDTGIAIRSNRAVDVLTSSFKGTEFRDGRIRFSEDTIEGYLHTLEREHHGTRNEDEPGRLGHGDPWSCLNLYDLRMNRIRPAQDEDLATIVRFLDGYGVKGKVPPVSLPSYPPRTRDLEATRICLENSEIFGGPTQTPGPDMLPLFIEMAKVTRRPMPVLAMLVNSPMSYDDAMLEFLIENSGNENLSIETVGGMSAHGNTSPLSLPAAHIHVLAEDLAAALFVLAVTGKIEAPYLRGNPFDMKYATFVVGGPEYILLDMASRKIHRFLTSVPREWGYLLSMSRKPDLQAVYERATGCWLQALNGATWFKGTGQLCSDEVFSPEQVVIDRYIVTGVQRLVRGLEDEWSIDESLAIIRQGLEESGFLAHPDTVDRFRDFYENQELFPAMSLGMWRQSGEPEVLAQAAKIVAAAVLKSTFVRPPEERSELLRICRAGRDR